MFKSDQKRKRDDVKADALRLDDQAPPKLNPHRLRVEGILHTVFNKKQGSDAKSTNVVVLLGGNLRAMLPEVPPKVSIQTAEEKAPEVTEDVDLYTWVENDTAIQLNVVEYTYTPGVKLSSRLFKLSNGPILRPNAAIRLGVLGLNDADVRGMAPCVIYNLYVSMTLSRNPGPHKYVLWMSASDLRVQRGTGLAKLPSADMVRTVFPHERQLFPLFVPENVPGFRPDAGLLTVRKANVTLPGVPSPGATVAWEDGPQVIMLAANRMVVSGGDTNPFRSAYILPDDEYAQTLGVTCDGGTSVALARFGVSLSWGDPKASLPELRGDVRLLVRQVNKHPADMEETGAEEMLARNSLTTRMLNVPAYEKPYVLGGIQNQLFGPSLMTPPAATGLPMMPACVLIEPDAEKTAMAEGNIPASAGIREDQGFDQAVEGKILAIMPRVAEYAQRYCVPVSRALVYRRFVTVKDYEKTSIVPSLPGNMTLDNCRASKYQASAYENTKLNMMPPSTTAHHGFIVLDELVGDRMNWLEAPEDGVSPHEFLFYAMPIYEFLCQPHAVPLVDDEAEVLLSSREVAPKRCGIATEEEGDAFVLKAVELNRTTRKSLDKFKVLDEKALSTNDLWMQEKKDVSLGDTNNKITRTYRLPLFFFIAVPRTFKPLRPESIVQPSAARRLVLAEGTAEPNAKRARIDVVDDVKMEASAFSPKDEMIQASQRQSDEDGMFDD